MLTEMVNFGIQSQSPFERGSVLTKCMMEEIPIMCLNPLLNGAQF